MAAPPTVRVTDTTARERDVAWSPDGKQLVYASDRIGQLDLFNARPAGPRRREVLPRVELRRDAPDRAPPEDEQQPVFSPDGEAARVREGQGRPRRRRAGRIRRRGRCSGTGADRVLLVARLQVDRVLARGPGVQRGGLDRPGGRWRRGRRLAAPESGTRRPVWSPDGRRLYWLSKRHANRVGLWAVYLTKADDERSPRGVARAVRGRGREEAGRADGGRRRRGARRRDRDAPSGARPKPAPRPVAIDLDRHPRARAPRDRRAGRRRRVRRGARTARPWRSWRRWRGRATSTRCAGTARSWRA